MYIANFFILFQQKYNIQIFEEGYLWSICEYLWTIPITSPGDKTASLHSWRIAEDKVWEFRSLLQRSQDMESERIIQIRDEFVAALESILMIPGNFDPKIQSLYTSCQPITNLLAK